MRSTLSNLRYESNVPTETPRHSLLPAIRVLAATPSNAGSSFESGAGSIDDDEPLVHIPGQPVLPESFFPAPATAGSASLLPTARGKRLVPKKSKLALLSSAPKRAGKEKDLSDVLRRVGAGTGSTRAASSGRAPVEVFVDPTDDPEVDEIVVVKKARSRASLANVFGTSNAPARAPEQAASDKENAAPVAAALLAAGAKDRQPAPQPRRRGSLGAMSLLTGGGKRSTGAASVLSASGDKSGDEAPRAKKDSLGATSLLTEDRPPAPQPRRRGSLGAMSLLTGGIKRSTSTASVLPGSDDKTEGEAPRATKGSLGATSLLTEDRQPAPQPRRKGSLGAMSILTGAHKRSMSAASALSLSGAKTDDEAKEKEKWWTLGRGRKDSKKEAKGNAVCSAR
jgi:hypothetical protein